MITREEFHEFSGLDDTRLSRPFSHKPPIKFGTIPWSHSDSTIAKYFKEMHYYMRKFNKTSITEGVSAVLSGQLDAFIYDGTVLDYLVGMYKFLILTRNVLFKFNIQHKMKIAVC